MSPVVDSLLLSAKSLHKGSFRMAIFILLITFATTLSIAVRYDIKSQKGGTINIKAENRAMICYGISTALLIILICLYK
jgi:hypothetical protein